MAGYGRNANDGLFIDSTANDFFARSHIPVSHAVFEMLLNHRDRKPDSEGLRERDEDKQFGGMAAELFSLWERRVIQMSPKSSEPVERGA